MRKIESFGYKKSHIINSLNSNVLNHATSCYYLLTETKLGLY